MLKLTTTTNPLPKRLLAVAWSISALAASLWPAACRSADKPNIVLIMADDMGYECVAANGGQSYKTPHLDRLAAGGTRFTHCYSQPLCTPSRVQIMTGIYNSRNYLEFGLLDASAYTFGNLLKEAGYATCIVGKWQLGGGFNAPRKFGFDEYCLWHLTRKEKLKGNRYLNPRLDIDGKKVDHHGSEYGPDLVSDYACEFMERHKNGPFFLYFPMILPHFPFVPTPDSADWNKVGKNEAGRGDIKYFPDMVAYTDKVVGKIVAKLESLGLRENTLVLFTGDNGTMRGITSRFEGRDWPGGKGRLTDAGTHVPLIANWPGIVPAGKVNNDLVDFSDFFPTLAEVVGAKVPEEPKLDGRSFAPQLRGQLGKPREWIYCWYFRTGKPVSTPNRPGGEWARTAGYKLYRDGRFFELPNDLDERSPIAESELTGQQREVRDRLRKVIEQNTRPKFYETTAGEKGRRGETMNDERMNDECPWSVVSRQLQMTADH